MTHRPMYLGHVNIYVRDAERSHKWYEEVLDLLLQQDSGQAIVRHGVSSSRPRNSRTRSMTSFFG